MKSEFYWGLFSSLIVALSISIFQYLEQRNYLHGLEKYETGSALGFALLPFFGIYFIVGVIMLFLKKSERFAKGLLLSALILLLVIISLTSGLIRFLNFCSIFYHLQNQIGVGAIF